MKSRSLWGWRRKWLRVARDYKIRWDSSDGRKVILLDLARGGGSKIIHHRNTRSFPSADRQTYTRRETGTPGIEILVETCTSRRGWKRGGASYRTVFLSGSWPHTSVAPTTTAFISDNITFHNSLWVILWEQRIIRKVDCNSKRSKRRFF